VEQASTLLTDYNARLQEELKERKKVGTMIAEFLSAQKELLAQVKTTFEIVAINEVCKERAVGPGKDDI
jgi:hypothetical protein